MRAIFLKEINSFFSGIIGYLVIAVFLLISGLFLWVFQGEYNILDYGFSSLSPFFNLAPWILIFLIPAVCMRGFSEENKQGTMELLLTKPLKKWDLVLGKYFGNLAVVFLALVPSLLYVFTIYQLGNPKGNLDVGELIGSYIGLFLLSGLFTAISLLASGFSKNQIAAFIWAVLLCFLSFYAFEGMAGLSLLGSETYAIEYLGISFHYQSISRGVLDTRNLIYFLSFTFFSLSLTKLTLNSVSR